MNSISRIADTATHDQLVQEYEEAYVDSPRFRRQRA